MEKWDVRYWDEGEKKKGSIEGWLDRLPADKLKSLAKELKLLELCGSELKLPHSKSLGKGLFELRERRFGLRIYYALVGYKIIILVNTGDKSRQEKDISVARVRLNTIRSKK
jgi:putative addiction module killer protein